MARPSSSTRGWRARSWNAEKHPRDNKGQFADKPDVPKVSRSKARATGKAAGKLIEAGKQDAKLQQERREFLAGLSSFQRRNLYANLTASTVPTKRPSAVPTKKPSAVPTKPVKPATSIGTPSKSTSAGDTNVKLKRIPTARSAPSADSIKITDKKVTIWQDKPDLRTPQKGFKVTNNRNFDYSVDTPDGQKLSLNKWKTRVEVDGEVVNGVPPITHNPGKRTIKQLVNDLATYSGYVEDSANVPVPFWTKENGNFDKKYVADRGLGQIQLHHQGQWTRKAFQDITDELSNGKITLDEAKTQMRDMLTPVQRVNKRGQVIDKYEIKVAPKGDREFVALAGGTHDFTSPLYRANHPFGVHPDTGKQEEFGIPAKGRKTDGNRDEYDLFRNTFWKEMYRRESKILSGELTKRLRKGETNPQEIQEIWENKRLSINNFKQTVLQWKKERKAMEATK